MLILGLILFGLGLLNVAAFVGVDWGMALVSGLVGSFVGGLIFSLVAGDGLELRASGIIGSILGALIVTALWRWRARSSGAAA